MANSLLKDKITQQVFDTIKANVSFAQVESLNVFIKSYFVHLSEEDIASYTLQDLCETLWSFWMFIVEKKPNTPKIKIYNQVLENSSFYTIVEVVSEDITFLIDSVIGAINHFGLFPHLIIHPVLQISRDHSGRLETIESNETEKGKYESLIRCEIPHAVADETLKILEEELQLTLHNVHLAVSDWKPMTSRLFEVVNDLKKQTLPISTTDADELIAFLEWIGNHHFTFLGYCQYDFVPSMTSVKRTVNTGEGLGILQEPKERELARIFEGVEFSPHNRRYLIEPDPLILTKTTQISVVHRRDPMDSLIIKRYEDGKVVGFHHFIGLFTSVAYNCSIRDIPLLRHKVKYILKHSGFAEEWHDGKALVHILESFPRDELFQASEQWLLETSTAVLQLYNRQRLTLFIRPDRFERHVSCLIYIPRDRYDNELRGRIAEILEESFQGRVAAWSTQLGELAFARLHIIVQLSQKALLPYDKESIEQKLKETALLWKDRLQNSLIQTYGSEKSQVLFRRYNKSFTKGYQEYFDEDQACFDISQIEKIIVNKKLLAAFSPAFKEKNNYFKLRIYSPQKPLPLSDVLPVLESMDLRILSEVPFKVTIEEMTSEVWIHDFEATSVGDYCVDIEDVQESFLEAFYQIWEGKIEKDGFNQLIIRAGLTAPQCQIFRAYAKYLKQLQVTFSQTYIEDTLAAHPKLTMTMIDLFICQFDPAFSEDREKKREEILRKIKVLLGAIQSIDEDRILRKFLNIISATVRTNFFQHQDNPEKTHLSFKLDCSLIDDLPLPKPLYEIFVYSARVEAVHLRGGKVARGGLRWSDRREDFRTEVLGLMKAQMVKNVVIVPTGSKGGFVVKQPPINADRLALMEEAIECYKIMIRGLLDITDNIIDGKVVTPDNIIRRDGDDPYLVVAADKGTASFSDYANQVSLDYKFWLGDAFASGGSAGYDHKKIGITARGAWESVNRHFREMDVDANIAELQVVGVGDMSGDVFGNGMLLSPHMKLVAAFNHLHIFIDPCPLPGASFLERKRLFELPRSSWSDYDSSLLSAGGAIYERSSKTIKLSSQAKEMLGIVDDEVTPDIVIRAILKMHVDLIWFGGIGTFIKAREESHADVGDRANDSIRINGQDIRAKVIAEGANLGVTQRGRIEYARAGGRINTDAIDNSAGVDCSDHEVNIKILLGQVMTQGKLDLQLRNKLLEEMTEEVATSILQNNFWQNQAISLAQSQGVHLLDEQAQLIRDLEASGLLNRELEGLPDEVEISRRMADKQPLMRSELAILMSYAKIALNHKLVFSKIPDSAHLTPKLLSYFPEYLRIHYVNEIGMHPLKREIVAMLITNSIVNRMGFTFVNEMVGQTGATHEKIVFSYLAVRDLTGLGKLWRDIEGLNHITSDLQIALLLDVYKIAKTLTGWFVRSIKANLSLEENILFFKDSYNKLAARITTVLPSKMNDAFEQKTEGYEKLGISRPLALELSHLSLLVSAPDIIRLSHKYGRDVEEVAQIYYHLGENLGFDWLRTMAENLPVETHWQRNAARSIIDDLYFSQKSLVKKILLNDSHSTELKTSSKLIDSMLADLKNAARIDLSMLTVIVRELRLFAIAKNV